MAAYIDLSKKHGHRNDHGFSCGAEFNVKIRRRIDIPDFVREQLSQNQIDEIWWEEAAQARDSLKETLSRRYKWIGELAFVGRGPGWLAIEDTGCKSRNWDTISKIVDQHLKGFIKSMESNSFWRDAKGVAPVSASQHATKKVKISTTRPIGWTITDPARPGWSRTGTTTAAELEEAFGKKTPAQLQREIDEVLAKPGNSRAHAMKKPRTSRGKPMFSKFDERSGDDWIPLWKFREMIVDGRIFDEDGSGKFGKLDGGQRMVSNVPVDLSRFATPHSFHRAIPTWARSVVWTSRRSAT